MFTDSEVLNAILRESSRQSSPYYALRSFLSVYTKALKHGANLDSILELGTGASVGPLFCFLANGARRACGTDISPIKIDPKDPFFVNLKLLLGITGSGGWYHRQMGHPSVRGKLDLHDCWWDLNPEVLADSIEYFAPYDARALPFESDSFDLIYSGAVLEHLTDPGSAIEEMHRVMKPNGICIHGIDLRSHNNKGWLSLYTLTPEEHRSISEVYEPGRGVNDIYAGKWRGQVFCNRVLAHEWKKLFSERFSIVEFEVPASIKPELINPNQFAKPFSENTSEQLAPLTVNIVARKS